MQSCGHFTRKLMPAAIRIQPKIRPLQPKIRPLRTVCRPRLPAACLAPDCPDPPGERIPGVSYLGCSPASRASCSQRSPRGKTSDLGAPRRAAPCGTREPGDRFLAFFRPAVLWPCLVAYLSIHPLEPRAPRRERTLLYPPPRCFFGGVALRVPFTP